MNEKIIITEPSSSLRARGRNSLEGMWKTAVLGYIKYPAAYTGQDYGLS